MGYGKYLNELIPGTPSFRPPQGLADFLADCHAYDQATQIPRREAHPSELGAVVYAAEQIAKEAADHD